MPKLTDKQLQQRKLEMAARSRSSIAKKELVQFRLEADKIVKLFEIAAEREMQMGTMLRQWVNERIVLEESKSDISFKRGKHGSRNTSTELVVQEPITDMYESNSRERRLDLLEQRIAKLETKLKNKKS